MTPQPHEGLYRTILAHRVFLVLKTPSICENCFLKLVGAMHLKGLVLLFHGVRRGNGLVDRVTFTNNQHCKQHLNQGTRGEEEDAMLCTSGRQKPNIKCPAAQLGRVTATHLFSLC